MALDTRLDKNGLALRLTGEIDHHRSAQLMQELETQLDLESPRQVELDLSGVTFMDSSGIALLLRLYRSLALTGGKLKVVGVPAQPGKVLKAAGLGRLFTIAYL
jgi:stage II sporulation protein AA (anti-sigma F factor antagonist)